ncbi:MAG: hypothetical protein LBT88_08025 [Oscillospiraceae bacterium]|jgi:hypothetical protein|nr:hypothetical protein [Oscillospiraceae bacterium]
MGLLNKMMGLGGAKSDAKKQEIRDVFNARVENGAEYTVLAAMNLVTEKKFLKEVRTYYNYIIGYKDSENPEIVVISTDSEVSRVGEPICCKKSDCLKANYLEKAGLFTIEHPALENQALNFSIILTSALGYTISVSYLEEYAPFTEFFKTRFVV